MHDLEFYYLHKIFYGFQYLHDDSSSFVTYIRYDMVNYMETNTV